MGTDYDVITVGAGLGGCALAKVLAEHGKRVLAIEREPAFKDRIRGEIIAPWGVAEAQRLGLYDTLLEKCAHQEPYTDFGGTMRDLRATTPQQLAALTFYHPAMQETVLGAAVEAGAEIWRGASVRAVCPGEVSKVSVEFEGESRDLTARMVVCADGRSSMGRTWGGFATIRGTQKLLGAGILLGNVSIDEDTGVWIINPSLSRIAYLFPLGAGRVRAYLVYEHELPRLQGAEDTSRFIEESVKTGAAPEAFTGACPMGPLASFDMTDHWVEHPYRTGLALLGDAAGASDPTWGQGLSLTMRDARVLSEKLLNDDDWDHAGHEYARERDRYFKTINTVGDWISNLFFARGAASDKRRDHALSLIASEPDRFPDHNAAGPELPFNEDVRKRFFGEI